MVLSISVITPSYNQGQFLERCIQSVSSQSVSAIEHLVYDPGSTDGSREIASTSKGVTLIAEADRGDCTETGANRAEVGKGEGPRGLGTSESVVMKGGRARGLTTCSLGEKAVHGFLDG